MLSKSALLISLCLTAASFSAAAAQSPATADKTIVKYQLEDWNRIHTKTNEEAEKLIETFKFLQVELEVSDHGNHKDLKYRCPNWKQLKVKDAAKADQWEAWLKKVHFKTVRSS